METKKVEEYIKKWLSSNSALNAIKIERKYDTKNKKKHTPFKKDLISLGGIYAN